MHRSATATLPAISTTVLAGAAGSEATLMRGAYGLERLYRFRETYVKGVGRGKGAS